MAYSLVNRTEVVNAQLTDTMGIQNTYSIDQVVVIGQRNQAVFSEVSRIIAIVRGDEIEKAGVQSIQDLLEFTSNIDIRQRGQNGVQSDVSIRGGSFDHVMVLINGINVSDPQTGHGSLDIPIDNEAIERVEILQGSAARVLGPGAFTGAVNIVTKRVADTYAKATQVLGSYGYHRTNIHAGFGKGATRHFLSAGVAGSDGYADDTDFRLCNLYYRSNLSLDNSLIDVQAGYQRKRFGAAGFYSPRFVNQYEETDVWFASVKASTGQKIKITPSVYWRRKRDHFLLERNDPDFYQNFHLTDVFGSQVNFSWKWKNVISTVGLDLRSEHILSNNIGLELLKPVPVKGHDSAFFTKMYGRTNFAYFQEHTYSTGNLKVSGGIMINLNTEYSDKPALFPGLDISYRILRGTRLFGSFNRALHLPTFTDLFYTDPVNQGNLDLSPNRMISFEGGIKYEGKRMLASVAFFRNEGQDIVDWLWSYETNRYSPVNLKNFAATGFEGSWNLDFPDRQTGFLTHLSMHYLFLDVHKSAPDSVSKYYNIRNKFSASLRHRVVSHLEASWNISFQDRAGELIGYDNESQVYFSTDYNPYWLVDGTLYWRWRRLDLFVTVANLLNTSYTDAGSSVQSGRWFKSGVRLKLGAAK